MGITLVVNPGSTSKKYALYRDGARVFSIRYEETGDGFGVCRERNSETQKCETAAAQTYKKSIEHCLDEAIAAGAIASVRDITAVGIRVVAPGVQFATHCLITDQYLNQLAACEEVAPLHVPAILAEIYALKALLSHVPLYAISDSAFHQTIPLHRRRLAIARQHSDETGIARYGYHGLSVSSVARMIESFFGIAQDRVIVLHVGGGISATALHFKESVDTSMGYTPASGIMMGSRVGDLDADALVALMAHTGMRSISVLSEYLNTKTGFQGLTGFSDLRQVLNRHREGDADASEALEIFRYQLHRSFGGHMSLLGGLDAVVLTGTAVVRNPYLRSFILDGLQWSGLQLDAAKNEALIGAEGMIHSDRSDVSIGVMKNDEMGEIARTVATLHDNQS